MHSGKQKKYSNSTINHQAKSSQYLEASNEGREFLSLGEANQSRTPQRKKAQSFD